MHPCAFVSILKTLIMVNIIYFFLMSAACHCTADCVSATIPNEWGLKSPSVRTWEVSTSS
jgi:hypothetical protein